METELARLRKVKPADQISLGRRIKLGFRISFFCLLLLYSVSFL
jgi:hypothetical protein